MDLPKRGTAARVCAAGMVCALFAAGSASANHPPTQLPIAKGVDGSSWSSYGLSAPSINTSTSSSLAAAKAAALPPASDNVQLVSKLGLETPAQYRIDGTQGQALLPGQIADVAVYKNAAYLARGPSRPASAAASSPSTSPTRRTRSSSRSCRRAPDTYHGEGAHAITLNTRRLPGRRAGGQQRAVRAARRRRLRPLRRHRPGQTRRSWCRASATSRPTTPAGEPIRADDAGPGRGAQQRALDLHLAGRRQGVRGDRRQHGALPTSTSSTSRTRPRRCSSPTSTCSSWRSTRASTSSTTRATAERRSSYHDMVVKQIDGVQTMLVVLLGRRLHQAQRRPTRRTRRSSATPTSATEDPLMKIPRHRRRPGRRPRATATRREFSHDNKFVLAADEDFDTHPPARRGRSGRRAARSTSPPPETRPTAPEPRPARRSRPRGRSGDTRFVGDACTAATIPPATARRQDRGRRARRLRLPGQDRERRSARLHARDHLHSSTTGAPPCEALSNMMFTATPATP